MALTWYNGWSGKVRQLRSDWVDTHAPLKGTGKCSLCGSTTAVGFHAEEYGGTREHYIKECYELCACCHGFMHMRYLVPNRFKRHKARIAKGDFHEVMQFTNLGKFFTVCKAVGDLKHEVENVVTGIPWLDRARLQKYEGPEKVAVIIDNEGIYRPDPTIYTNVTSLHGMLWDADTGTLSEFHYGPQQTELI